MIAFHGQQAIKDKYLARVRTHRLADEIKNGYYWQDGKGCAVGCTIHSSDHTSYESKLGIPRVLAWLEDGIFEALSNGRAKEWPERFLMAPRVGADLTLVWPKFAVWLLVDEKYGVLQFVKQDKAKKAIQDVADGYKLWVDKGLKPALNWWALCQAAAYTAAADFADFADVASAAAYAADAAAADAADYAAKRQEWHKAQADKLLELMSEAPVVA